MSASPTKAARGTTAELISSLSEQLPHKRWYAGSESPAEVEIEETLELGPGMCGIVRADGARYQVLWSTDGSIDVEYDQPLALALLDQATGGVERAELARPSGVEQSNTSWIYDDRLFLKLYRRLHDGPNPDVEVPEALLGAGFTRVPEICAVWRRAGTELAVVTRYLTGASEGWALALASLRDCYSTRLAPERAGGDFAAESARLGEVVAQLHVALSSCLPRGEPPPQPSWHVRPRMRGSASQEFAQAARRLSDRLAAIEDAGAAIRVHGDLHLAQLMRADEGWYVLDFEGEPSKPLSERRLPSSPLRDIAGMLRSFHYATAVVLLEREESERDELGELAEAWEARNRDAFLHGYLAVEGVRDLLPPRQPDLAAMLAAFELQKALYEVEYERAHRPDWQWIPEQAIARLATRR